MDFILFCLLRDFQMRFHASGPLWDFMRFPNEISCFFDPYETSLWDFTSMHYIKSIRMFEVVVTSPEHALAIQGGSVGGFGLVEWCNRGFFRPVFLRVDCECNRPSFLATVFYQASVFNGDLSQWDVAKVTTMRTSKLIRILENALTGRELMLYCLEGSVGDEECGRWGVLPYSPL